MAPQELGRKWVPRDADELLEAFNAGFLDETHWCDLKADLGSNRESAKDVAAFSIDGGTIVIGIDEKKPDGEPRHPVTLKGLPEKLEQIAGTLIHPPLQISCTTIESGDGDGKGYVLVHIPASALAPHQVDSTYYARGDKTTIRMSEPEVERLYQRRAQWNRDVGELLAQAMGSFPQFGEQHLPFLYAVARPVGGPPDMCRELVSGPDWRDRIEQLKFNAGRNGFCSGLGYSVKSDRGALLSSHEDPYRSGTEYTRLMDIAEDGRLRLFFNAPSGLRKFNLDEYIGVELGRVVAIVRELLVVAAYLSKRSGHSSMWELGVGLDCMGKVRPIIETGNPFYFIDHPGYPGNEYLETTRASVLELEKTPGAVAERLVGRLYRNFDIDSWKELAIFADPTDEADMPE